MEDLIRRQDVIDAFWKLDVCLKPSAIDAILDMLNTLPSTQKDIDEEDIAKSVVLLDLFMKTFCRYSYDYERFDDLKFRCGECPFEKGNICLCKEFKSKFAPDYKDLCSMGDL